MLRLSNIRVPTKRSRAGGGPVVPISREVANLLCWLCNTGDGESDYVKPEELWAWGYYRNGKASGTVCYYCRRVWEARHKAVYTLTAFKIKLGEDRFFFFPYERPSSSCRGKWGRGGLCGVLLVVGAGMGRGAEAWESCGFKNLGRGWGGALRRVGVAGSKTFPPG